MASTKDNGKTLVIVESPAKAKTINKYLGGKFVVKASMGHVRDLPPHDFGIDLGDNFRPTYEISRGRSKVVTELKKLAEKAPEVVLATDRDREGEAIAWHLVEALNLPGEKIRRVIFNEITKSAIRDAFEHPHTLDLDRVNAQQARRILDRIVGYELSPLLWSKIAKGLSAGRVQSVAVRLIVEREREIREFVPEESWKIVAYLAADPAKSTDLTKQWRKFVSPDTTQKDIQRWLSDHAGFKAELVEIGGKPFDAKDVEAAKAAAEALGFVTDEVRKQPWKDYPHLNLELVDLVGGFGGASAAKLRVSDLTTKRTQTRPPGPFTTATLQQQSSTQLRFAASRTMRVAQALYEGIDIGSEGSVGLITYMRTDSTNLSGESLTAVRDFIDRQYGANYKPEKPNFFGKRQERAQEAHEAIRPTDPTRTPESLKKHLNADQFKLYDLIWRRFVSCQMKPAEWDSTSVSVACDTKLGEAKLNGSGRKLVFDGFMKVAGVSSEDLILPELRVEQPVGVIDLAPKQHWTSPPPRYTEASLVKTLESEGIGRPSTYASIIETIVDRGYVEQEDRKFFPTSLGELVTDKLVAHFPKIMDIKFTSHMEDELDKIEESHLDWVQVLNEFYEPFSDLLKSAGAEMEKVRSQPSDYTCPECDAPMVYRWSKTGRFLSCSRYPDCKATMPVARDGSPLTPDKAASTCELCGKAMVVRQSRTGSFLGCSGYPECRNTIPCDENGVPLQMMDEEELQRPCEACGEGTMVVKWKRLSAFLGCDRHPKCKNTGKIPEGVAVRRKPAPPPEVAGVACEKCGRAMVIRVGRTGRFVACSGYPRCRTTHPEDKLEEIKAKQKAEGVEVPPLEEKPSKSKRAPATKVDVSKLGEPPKGFAWTRTGRPVVETMPEEGELKCPECKSTMELRRGRFGPFFSCTNFPKCKFVSNLRGQAKKDAEEMMPGPEKAKPIPTDLPCEECGQPMLIRESRRGKFLGCSAYPKCRATKEMTDELEAMLGVATS
ncbi:MAG: type I DNA topoisomerase [Phycisphaerales bacterium]|nr:type I DNA topoisomerase [Phycisphaerales bacterium]